MSQSMLLPAFFALFGVVAALFLLGFGNQPGDRRAAARDDDISDDHTEATACFTAPAVTPMTMCTSTTTNTSSTPCPATNPTRVRPNRTSGSTSTIGTTPSRWPRGAEHLLHAPADTWHWGHLPRAGDAAVESWQRPLDDPPDPPPSSRRPSPGAKNGAAFSTSSSATRLLVPKAEPIGFAHNGFHVDDEQRFQPLRRPDPGGHSRHASRHEYRAPGAPSRKPEDKSDVSPLRPRAVGRHSRIDPDDAPSHRHGRHSMPGHD